MRRVALPGRLLALLGVASVAGLLTSSAEGLSRAAAAGAGLSVKQFDNEREDTEPAWSPDGRRIAFVSRHGDHSDLAVINADGTKRRSLSHNYNGGFAWSPDGRRIVFASTHGSIRRRDISVVNAAGGNERRLIRAAAYVYEPSWSPDGRSIVFTRSSRKRSAHPGIYVMNADGTGMRRVTPSSEHASGPTWSPDGKRIAFVKTQEGPTRASSRIYKVAVIDADGSHERQLTHGTGYLNYLDWSPDSRTIMFVAKPSEVRASLIAVVGADGTNRRKLTTGLDAFQPAWSPDGRTIAYVTRSSVFRMNADGSDQHQLTETPDTSQANPTWSPGGGRIALVVYGGQGGRNSTHLFVMNADGSGRRPLTAPAFVVE